MPLGDFTGDNPPDSVRLSRDFVLGDRGRLKASTPLLFVLGEASALNIFSFVAAEKGSEPTASYRHSSSGATFH